MTANMETGSRIMGYHSLLKEYKHLKAIYAIKVSQQRKLLLYQQRKNL